MKAKITMNDQGGIARLEAKNGTLDTQHERMTLRDDVRVWTENGQEAKLRSASVNFKAGTVVSKEPVVVTLPNGVINAAGVEVTENGKVLRFAGRVSTVFENAQPAAPGAGSAAPSVTAPTAQAQPTSFSSMIKVLLLAALTASALAAPAWAQNPAKPPAAAATGGKDRSSAFGNLGSNKEPIKIDADQLDVFDKESRAVFDRQRGGGPGRQHHEMHDPHGVLRAAQPAGRGEDGHPRRRARPAPPTTRIRKIDCRGPVTIVSKTQVATGDNATFDRVANKVFLIGNAALSDGPNVTRGERIVYDLNTSVANVETAPGGRVKALFVPGSRCRRRRRRTAKATARPSRRSRPRTSAEPAAPRSRFRDSQRYAL